MPTNLSGPYRSAREGSLFGHGAVDLPSPPTPVEPDHQVIGLVHPRNRGDWVDDPRHWQARTQAIEDRLSDALHVALTQRFVDKRGAHPASRLLPP